MDLAFLSCSGLEQNPAYVFIFLCFSLSHSGAGACRASVGAVGAAHILHNITEAAWEQNVTDGLAAASRRV